MSCCFCFCLLLALGACLYLDLLKPFLVEEHQNKPFSFAFPTGGVPSTAVVMSILVLLRWSLKSSARRQYCLLKIPLSIPPPVFRQSRRMNGIFKLNLAQLSETTEFPWSKVLPLALMTVRWTALRVHQLSPNKLVTGLPKHLGLSPPILDSTLLGVAIAKYCKGSIQ